MKTQTPLTGIALVIASLAWPSMALGQDYPNAIWNPADTNNFGVASRAATDIRWIVIHTTEDAPGSDCSVSQSWFKNPDQNGDGTPGVSAHYVICRDGTVVQMVRDKDIAYHAGNLAYNQQSIGIEHERHDTSNWTEAQFQASVLLARWLVSRYSIQGVFPSGIAPANPGNGSGIIGHIQVPDPNNPTLGGGAAHKTDPVNWDWPHYESLFMNSSFALRVAPAVHVAWPTTTNRAYQLLTAAGVEGPYSPVGGLIEGTGGEVSSFSEASAVKQFFRVEETTGSPLSWLHGTWIGPASQTTPLKSFTTRLDANPTNRVFTINYSGSFTCTSVLSLLSYSDSQAFFHDYITSGSCYNSTVLFVRINQTNIAYHFFATDPLGTGGGLLTKQ